MPKNWRQLLAFVILYLEIPGIDFQGLMIVRFGLEQSWIREKDQWQRHALYEKVNRHKEAPSAASEPYLKAGALSS